LTATLATETLYARVQHFYAWQMQALDDRQFEEYANTFTPDGVFKHSPKLEAAHGRAGIVKALVDFHHRFDNDPVQRRHWFNHVKLELLPDGSISSTVYVLVVTTRPGGKPEIAPSCVMRDVLMPDGDALYTRSRRVSHDQETL
jgi:actinorhodin biosynthesis protein ActVIA